MLNAGTLHYFLISIIILYFLSCLIVGGVGMRNISSLKEFALGFKNINTGILVATMYATHLGAGSTLGLIEQINNVGIVGIIATLGGIFRWHVTRAIFCNNLERFKGCLSQGDVMGRLYGTTGLIISNIVNIIASVGIVAIQVVVIGFLMQYFFSMPAHAGTIAAAVIVTIYATSGGVKAVILTDVLQLTLFAMIVVIIYMASMFNPASSRPDYFTTLPASKMWFTPYDTRSTLLFVGLMIYALIPVGGNAPFIQRILISGSSKQLYSAFTWAKILDIFGMCAITGLAILLLEQTGDGILTKEILFKIAGDTFNPVVVTGIIIGVMAVTMSTADSWLNSGAVMITNLIANNKPGISDNQQVQIARIVTILLGTASAYVAMIGDSVLSLLLLTTCFMEPLILVPIAAGFLGYEFTERSYQRSVMAAMIGVFIGAFIEGQFGFIALGFGIIGSTLGLIWQAKDVVIKRMDKYAYLPNKNGQFWTIF